MKAVGQPKKFHLIHIACGEAVVFPKSGGQKVGSQVVAVPKGGGQMVAVPKGRGQMVADLRGQLVADLRGQLVAGPKTRGEVRP